MESGQKSVAWWVLVAAAAILAVALVVQIVLRDSEPSTKSVPPTASLPTSPSVQSADVDCLEYPPIPNPAAPAYQGPGPHLIIPGSPGPDLGVTLHPVQINEGYLPRNWLPANHTEFTSHWWNSSEAALIFCPTEVVQIGRKPVGACDWIDSPSTKAYPARWTFAVYEIRTGRKVTTFSLPSDGSKGPICPGSMQAPAFDSAQPPSSEALKAVLSPLVMRNVP